MSSIPLLWEKIASAENILLINHIRMDPDAFWSLAGLAQILHSMWKNVQAINDEVAPEDFSFLWQNHLINPHLNIQEFNPDLIISLDAASLDQLWNSYSDNKEIFDSRDFFVVDHHISNPWFWQYNIIKTDFSSTCEIVYSIIEELNYSEYMNANIATCLFAGIITDTNVFYNQNTSPNTHRIAWELMTCWANFRLPITEFYKKKSFKASKLWGEVLKDMEQIVIPLSSKHNSPLQRGTRGGEKEKILITYALVKQEYFDKTKTTDIDISGLINEFLSNMENWDVSFLLYPLKNWQIKASMRSQEINISTVCQKFWWGGHKLAWGFSSNKTIEEIKDDILEELTQ